MNKIITASLCVSLVGLLSSCGTTPSQTTPPTQASITNTGGTKSQTISSYPSTSSGVTDTSSHSSVDTDVDMAPIQKSNRP